MDQGKAYRLGRSAHPVGGVDQAFVAHSSQRALANPYARMPHSR
jgi:hypothetical protein